MKKNILGILILSLVLVIGSVSAAMNFIAPDSGDYVNTNSIDVQWENPSPFTSASLQYKLGSCTGTGWSDPLTETSSSSNTNYVWDITSLIDGKYCLRFQTGEDSLTNSGLFTIDRINPIASFTYEGDSVGVLVKFDASESSDASGIASYSWDFGDGATGTGKTPSHTYSETGAYNVQLTVTDKAGNTGIISHLVIIYDDETQEFEAGIKKTHELNPAEDKFDTGLAGITCSVVAGADIPNGITISQDGNSCTLSSLDISYFDAGVYTIPIQATDGTITRYYKITLDIYSWWIPLSEGWNLISIPMMPESKDIKDVFKDIRSNIVSDSKSVYGYDASTKKWDWNQPTSTSWKSTATLDTIEPGYGYFVKMEDSTSILKGFGSIVPGEVPKVPGGETCEVSLSSGWNLIGVYGLNNPALTKELALTSIDSYYDAVRTGSDSLLHPYAGYWMTMKSSTPADGAVYTPSQEVLSYLN